MQVGRSLHLRRRPSLFSPIIAGQTAVLRGVDSVRSHKILPIKCASHYVTRFGSPLASNGPMGNQHRNTRLQVSTGYEACRTITRESRSGYCRRINPARVAFSAAPEYLSTLEVLTDITGWTARPRHG